MRVIAFDIDGTLTEPEVREVFREVSRRSDTLVGVISARRPSKAVEFIKENDIDIDFEEMGFAKIVPLTQQKLGLFSIGDEFVYVGNTPRDRFASFITRWRFIHSDDAEQLIE